MGTRAEINGYTKHANAEMEKVWEVQCNQALADIGAPSTLIYTTSCNTRCGRQTKPKRPQSPPRLVPPNARKLSNACCNQLMVASFKLLASRPTMGPSPHLPIHDLRGVELGVNGVKLEKHDISSQGRIEPLVPPSLTPFTPAGNTLTSGEILTEYGMTMMKLRLRILVGTVPPDLYYY